MNIGFVGLGVMGFPMAGHLAAKGYDVAVYNRTQAKADEWVKKHNGVKAATPADAVKDADLVFACLGDDPDVSAVADAALDGLKLPYELLEYELSGSSDKDIGLAAARALGLPEAAVFKTLIAELPDGELVVAMIPVAEKVNLKKLARAAGAKSARLTSPSISPSDLNRN